MGGVLLSYVTTLLSLGPIGLVKVEIYNFLFITWPQYGSATWLCGWGLLILSHHPAKFEIHRLYGTRNNDVISISVIWVPFPILFSSPIPMPRFQCEGLQMAAKITCRKCDCWSLPRHKEENKGIWNVNTYIYKKGLIPYTVVDTILNKQIIFFSTVPYQYFLQHFK